MNDNLKTKLGSRKFWAFAASVAMSALVLFGTDADTITKVVALVGAIGSCVVYMFAEASVDAAREKRDHKISQRNPVIQTKDGIDYHDLVLRKPNI
ncbi:hypothetical protein [Brevibacillus sp. BC25]|uniref:hypothetical protein n=1 Tax=Brevibacillus sp. BC25 TaxID=1144308 RepID=UPI000270DD59|nr:hypothetical protein [Brevibacillus sp. BC25]EJL31778.1 hypothetical protein PMI05_00543 [Brevibacillus sp. BC25]